MPTDSAQPDSAPTDAPLPPGEVRLLITERIDPEAADALWRVVMGGVEADTGGGPSAAGAGTRQAGRQSDHTAASVEAGPDVSA